MLFTKNLPVSIARSLFIVTILLIDKHLAALGKFCKNHRHLPAKCEKAVIEKSDKILCSGKFDDAYASYFKIRTLVLCNVVSQGYDPRLISKFQHLYKFTLIQSNITHFTDPFPEHSHLQVLNLTHLELQYLHVDVFRNLKSLKILDLSYNKLRTFGKHHSEFLPNLQQLYLRGNNWDCNLELKWIVGKRNGKISLSKKVIDLQQLVCSGRTYSRMPAVIVMTWLKNLESECPRNDGKACKCSLDNVVYSMSKSMVPVITVDCGSMGFKRFPTQIPQNTSTLILSNNQIADVTPLLNNSLYLRVQDLYLDNNNISTVDQLERADWLSSFRVFSLRGNNLTTIPTYAFDHVFEKNANLARVFLGNNSWVCDCSFTPEFQELLRKYTPEKDTLNDMGIYDWKDVKCAKSEDDSNSLKVIKELPLVSICRNPSQLPISSWDLLNIVLMALIFFVLCNLIYDYWVFKTSAKLPWIATKLF